VRSVLYGPQREQSFESCIRLNVRDCFRYLKVDEGRCVGCINEMYMDNLK